VSARPTTTRGGALTAMTPAFPGLPSHSPPRLICALALAALAFTCLLAPRAQAASSDYGIDSVSASRSTSEAGAHPDVVNRIVLKTDPSTGDPWAATRDLIVDLPEGLTGNPTAVPQCNSGDFRDLNCPFDSQVGLVKFRLSGTLGDITEPLYSLEPPGGDGDVVARLAFWAYSVPAYVNLKVDPADHYRVSAQATGLSDLLSLVSVQTTVWGVPADSTHDTQRMTPQEVVNSPGITTSPPRPISGTPVAFMTNPTSCSTPQQFDFTARSYPDPNVSHTASVQLPDTIDCGLIPFDPSIALQPTTQEADSASGLDVDLSLPQGGLTDPNGLATADLKKAVVTMPEGVALNPSAGDGLAGCTEAQVGLVSESPITFDASQATCPDGSKVGTAQITTPVLPDPIPGSLYLADPNDNPFHSLLSGYLVAHGEGVTLKLAGRFDLDPNTGRITATFDDNPQQPFSDLQLHFKGGSRGVLVTPPSCGTYQIDSKLVPWSAADPNNPTPAEVKDLTSTFDVSTGPGGGPCPDYLDPSRFTPGFSAGTTAPLAGSSTGFVLKVTRPDGQQSLKQIHLDLPPGLVAHLAGVPRCPQSAITPTSASCPPGSQIGVVNVGAGAGSPFFLTNQPVYLTDGYGPLDLGHVVVRSQLTVDPDDAQVHVDSETLPRILEGIPLHIRSVSVNVNRPGFMQNPTNCNPMQVTGTVTGGGANFDNPADDTVKPVSDHFQVGGCSGLGFSPKLSGAILNGAQGIHRSDHPNLSFNLHATPGDANISSVAVTLPQAFQIDQANLGNICSETELATNQCAGRNAVGTASATTPLLDSTLSGPVYAVSGSGGLPKLAVILNGPAADPLHLLVRGITTTVGARIANTFPLVPDAPITDFGLTLNGGPAGYLVNNTDVCAGAKGKSKKARKKASRLRRTNLTAAALFTAQDGDTLTQSVPISAQCPKAKKGKKSKRH
jgi:hypothetical protein